MNAGNGNGGGGLANRLRRFIRGSNEGDLRTTLAELVDQDNSDTPTISPAERQIIENALRLNELTIADVMAPRADIDAVDVADGVAGAIKKAGATYHSRLPVFRGDLDDVIGMVHTKDLLVAVTGDSPPPEDLTPLLRDVLFVVPSMRAIELLLQMRVSRTHMALVVDEYGGIDGLVTVEDVIEEIVGEMRDEHDSDTTPELADQPDGTLIVDARAFLDDFEARVGYILTEEEREEIDTIGGLVVTLLGRVPSRGEIITHSSGVEFEVLAVDPRRVHRLRARNLPTSAVDEAATPAPEGDEAAT